MMRINDLPGIIFYSEEGVKTYSVPIRDKTCTIIVHHRAAQCAHTLFFTNINPSHCSKYVLNRVCAVLIYFLSFVRLRSSGVVVNGYIVYFYRRVCTLTLAHTSNNSLQDYAAVLEVSISGLFSCLNRYYA